MEIAILLVKMNKKLIILGGGGHARALLDALGAKIDMLIGYADPEMRENFPLPYLGSDEVLQNFSPEEILLLNGLGSVMLPLKRQEIYLKFKEKGFSFQEVIHEKANLSNNAILAEGVQLMSGATIGPEVHVGENVLINTGAIVEHHCKIGNHSHVASGAILLGGSSIGRACHIGAGAILIQGVTIGDEVLVGAGSLVNKNLPSGVKVYGSPARITT